MIGLIILLGVSTIALPFLIAIIIDKKKLGVASESRFIERGQLLPNGKPLTAQNFKSWVKANPKLARPYAFPVLLPLDVFYMVALGAFTAVASLWLYKAAGFIPNYSWLALVLPIGYVVVDLIEDVIAARMLRSADAVTPSAFSFLRRATSLKMFFVVGAIVQTGVLAVVGIYMGK